MSHPIPDIPKYMYESHKHIQTNEMLPLFHLKKPKQEYFDVEILADDEDTYVDNNIDAILNMNKSFCHICNIQVPISHIKEHQNSVKHKTCHQITNIALERVKLQINSDITTLRKVEILETYFCDPCAAVVLNSDKQEHDQSKNHKISVKHDEMLENLLKAYESVDNIEIEERNELDELKNEIDVLELVNAKEKELSGIAKDLVMDKIKMFESELYNTVGEEVRKVIVPQYKAVHNDVKEMTEIMEKTKIKLAKMREEQESAKIKIKELENDHQELLGQSREATTLKRLRSKLAKRNGKKNEKMKANEKTCPVKSPQGVSEITMKDITQNKITEKTSKKDIKNIKPVKYDTHEIKEIGSDEDNSDTHNNKVANRAEEIEPDDKINILNDAASKIKQNEKYGINGDDFEKVTYELIRSQIYSFNNISAEGSINEESIEIENEHEKDKANKVNQKDKVVANEKCKGESSKENPETVNESNTFLNEVDKKVSDLLAKYFDTSCTVAALNDKRFVKVTKIVKEDKTIENDKVLMIDKDILEPSESKIQTLNKIELNNNKIIENKNKVNEIIDDSVIVKTKDNPVKETETTKKEVYSQDDKIKENIENSDAVRTKDNTIDKTKCTKIEIKFNENSEKPNTVKTKDKIKPNKKDLYSKVVKIDEIKEKSSTTLKIPKPLPKTEKSQGPSNVLVNYLKDIARKTQFRDTHSVKPLTENIIEIKALNGDIIKVPINNFHSFHVKALNTYCKVCEKPNVGRAQFHITEFDHVLKIMAPIEDQNGIRKVDDIWSHCVLCNDLTKNLDFHLESLLHKNKRRQCLVSLGKDCPTYKNETKTQADEATMTLMTEHNLILTKKGYLNCVVCDVIVNLDFAAVNQHIKSFEHLKKIQEVQEENNLLEIEVGKFYCISCDTNFVKAQVFPHCNGRKHKKLFEEYCVKQGIEVKEDGKDILLPSIGQNVRKPEGKIDDSELICFVCNIVIYCTDEHIDTFQHKKSYLAYLEANKLNEIEADTFYCMKCNIIITIDYLMSHCLSKKHKTSLQCVETEKDLTVNSNEISNTLIPNSDKLMPLKVLYQFREMTDSSKLLCTVCDEEIIYRKKDAMYHVSTLHHIVAFNLMMLWNKIKKRVDKYFCDICRVDLTYFSEITHVFGKQHVGNLAKEAKGTVYEYNRTLVSHSYAMSHKVGDRTRPSAIVSVLKK